MKEKSLAERCIDALDEEMGTFNRFKELENAIRRYKIKKAKITPRLEEQLLCDSQFVNAAEYGSDKVLKTGEIGSYLGCRIYV